jgi:hypothetical protein
VQKEEKEGVVSVQNVEELRRIWGEPKTFGQKKSEVQTHAVACVRVIVW